MEAQNESQAKVHYEQDMNAHVENIGAWIVSSLRKDMASSCIHAEIFPLLLLGGSSKVGNIPHSKSRQERDRAVDDPVGRDKVWSRAVPKVNGESGSNAGKDGIGNGCQQHLTPSNLSLYLRAVYPSGDVDQIVRDDDDKLQDDKAREEQDHGASPIDVGRPAN